MDPRIYDTIGSVSFSRNDLKLDLPSRSLAESDIGAKLLSGDDGIRKRVKAADDAVLQGRRHCLQRFPRDGPIFQRDLLRGEYSSGGGGLRSPEGQGDGWGLKLRGRRPSGRWC